MKIFLLLIPNVLFLTLSSVNIRDCRLDDVKCHTTLECSCTCHRHIKLKGNPATGILSFRGKISIPMIEYRILKNICINYQLASVYMRFN